MEEDKQEKLHREAIEWAAYVRGLDDAVVLDTESCGGRLNDEVISIGVVRVKDGKKLFYSLLKPQSDVKFNWYATQVHGITPDMLTNAPTLLDIWEELEHYVGGKTVLAYNSSADKRMLTQTADKSGIHLEYWEIDWHCVMLRYKHYKKHSKVVTLTQACEEMRVEPGGHNALEDALATARLVYRMEHKYGTNR